MTAFEENGIELTENANPDRAGEFISIYPTLFVLVRTQSDADGLWSNEELNPVARRGNVVVAHVTPGIATRDKKRVVAALEALPESDFEVELEGG